MTNWRQLLACPACRGGLAPDFTCSACGASYPVRDGAPRLMLETGLTQTGLTPETAARVETVRRFYEAAPFPGYPPNDSLSWLRRRAARSRFAALLEEAIPGDARVLELGCGTGQMCLYLARADRLVVGADVTAASIDLAAAAARRFGVEQAHFIQTDLHRPGLREAAFDVVYCSGVLHHTPDPQAAFGRIVRLAKPGGMIVVGLYNSLARIPLRLRRAAGRLSGYRWIPGDPVLRDRAAEPARREAWLRDQYQHPEEHRHTVAEVQTWFRVAEVDYVRSFPSTLLAEDGEPALFAPAADDWGFEAWLAQLGWMRSLGGEGGLFVMVGRRRGGEPRRRPVALDAATAQISA
jgi:2-polyprenyl-3-methyl-5-hydroxy-6-metoxy-1,4-benzoquinol methylase